jgi:large subunit ribosomal protein L21
MKYAIVESGGKQYRAVEGGTIEVDRLPAKPGENVKLEQILLFADGENVTVGTPLIKDFPVWTTVLEHFKGEKVTIFNYSPKKRIRVKTGHRQNYTRLAIEQIGGSEFVKKEPAKKEKKPKADESAEEMAAETTAVKKSAPKVEKKPAAKGKTTETAAKSAKKTTTTTKTGPKTTKAAPKKPAAKPATKPAEKSSPGKTAAKKPAEKK